MARMGVVARGVLSLVHFTAVGCFVGEMDEQPGLDSIDLWWNADNKWESNDIPVCWDSFSTSTETVC